MKTLKDIAIELMVSNFVHLSFRKTLIVTASYKRDLEEIAERYDLELVEATDSSSRLFVTGEFKLKTDYE